MLEKYPIAYEQTYNGAVLQAVEPKLEAPSGNAQATMEQAKDKAGVPKWLVYLNMDVKTTTGKKKFENITITVTSPNKPYDAIPLNSPVIIEKLSLGTMLREKGSYTLYYTAEAIRPVAPERVASAQPQQSARVATGERVAASQ